MFILAVHDVSAQEDGMISETRDGLKLSVVVKLDPNSRNTLIACKLENQNAVDVPYFNRGPAMGFSLRLKDSSGKAISALPRWTRWYVPSEMSKHAAQRISPGSALTFSFLLEDAFGEEQRPSACLDVTWDPGNIQQIQPPPLGRGLSASINIPRGEQQSFQKPQPNPGGEKAQSPHLAEPAATPQKGAAVVASGSDSGQFAALGVRSMRVWLWVVGFAVLSVIALILWKGGRV